MKVGYIVPYRIIFRVNSSRICLSNLVELGVVIGKTGRDIPTSEAFSFVEGTRVTAWRFIGI
jgi:hypothetical protein